ncbi:MAG: hypothetical protein COA63_006295 [Methylophaga sp.]|nr:hypothetical protein [Methylophaga sp.]
MSNKLFFNIHSIIYAAFALALFFIPDYLWPIYGLEVNDQYARFLSQHNSIFLGGIAGIIYFFRNIETKTESAQNLLKGLVFTNILGFIITLYACINGIFVGFGWSDPVFFGGLAGLSLWQLKKRSN